MNFFCTHNLFSLFILIFILHFFRFNFEGENYREEPKAIVFLSKLLILFQSCNLCFASNPLLSISQSGTMLTIKSTCSKCNDVFTWTSQPHMLGKFPAGNLLLSFAILCSGASINKVLLMFQHMGILVYHYPTYYYHQRHLLVPSIVKYWRGYQAEFTKEIGRRGSGTCWRWQARQYGPFGKIWHIHHILLHHWLHYPYCASSGNSFAN